YAVGEAGARSEVERLVGSTFALRASGVASVDDAHGRIGVYHRFLSRRKARNSIEELGVGEPRLPPQAEVQRQFWRRSPVVLHEEAVLVPAHALVLPRALNKSVGCAEQKVGEVGVGEPGPKRKAARLGVAVDNVLDEPHHLTAEDQLVFPFD